MLDFWITSLPSVLKKFPKWNPAFTKKYKFLFFRKLFSWCLRNFNKFTFDVFEQCLDINELMNLFWFNPQAISSQYFTSIPPENIRNILVPFPRGCRNGALVWNGLKSVISLIISCQIRQKEWKEIPKSVSAMGFEINLKKSSSKAGSPIAT